MPSPAQSEAYSRKDERLDDVGKHGKSYESVANEENKGYGEKTGGAKQPAHGNETLMVRPAGIEPATLSLEVPPGTSDTESEQE